MNPRDRERQAARALRECRAALASRGSSVVREALGGNPAAMVDWRHYPEGEAYDPTTHVQYFYHRHAAAPSIGSGSREHGHFHLFLRGDGIPAGIAPLLLPDLAVANAPAPRQSAPLKRGSRDEVCHIIAISVDAHGEPVRLFTTNRWVTGETWYRADDVIRILDAIRLDGGANSGLLDRWIEAVVGLFQAEIAVLLRDRDRAIMDWRWRWPRRNPFEDVRLEVPSSFAIDLEARLAAAEYGAAVHPAPTGMRGARHLPSMAEGWGA